MGLLDKLLSIVAGNPVVPVPTAKVEKKLFAGKISPLPEAITRWTLSDLETAIHTASKGDLHLAGQLMASAQADGVIRGVLSTRSDGLVKLPRKLKGRKDLVAILEGDEIKKGIIDQMLPPGEIAKMAADGATLAVSVGRMVEVVSSDGRVTEILHRLDPRYLQYRWHEDTWYFNSLTGPLPITPGKEGWVLYLAGGADSPWDFGSWKAVGRAFIIKEHAVYNRENYANKIAFPARVGYMKENSTEKNRLKFISQLMQWGSNTSIALPEGWDTKILESNGRGFEIFSDQISNADQEIMIALTGQIVTTMGTNGFSNGNIHQAIRLDMIQSSAESLAECLNTQVLKPWVNKNFGADAMAEAPEISWDTTPPEDTSKNAATLVSLLNSKMIQDSINASQQMIDPEMLKVQYGIKLVPSMAPQAPQPAPMVAPMTPEESSLPIPDETDSTPVDLVPDYAASLAEAMTLKQMKYCEHGRANECDWCGVERTRAVVEDEETGEAKYALLWRPMKGPSMDTKKPRAKRTLKSRTNVANNGIDVQPKQHPYRGQ